jgi:DNA helicase-2/ATP-dependent DNA helicase PcrA
MTPQTFHTSEIDLNPEQRAAVEHGDGPLLVVAGAGTGKTRVIVERIRCLLEANAELSGESILGLTFTDKSAGEMKSRLKTALGKRADGVWLGTFHSFCMEQVLREVNPDVRAIDDVDYWILLRRNIASLGLNLFRRLAEPGQFLRDFISFFARCQDEMVTAEDYQHYLETLKKRFQERLVTLTNEQREAEAEEIARQEELAHVYRVSERLLRDANQITFSGQLLQAVQRLQSDPELREKMRARFRYVLVDEFQDTNIVQIELLWLLAGGHRNIVAVGDHHQAIYRFRGASFGSFTIFLERFANVKTAESVIGAIAGENAAPLVSLTRNYRSTERILNVAAQVIEMNPQAPLLSGKRLTSDQGEGKKIRIVEFDDAYKEAHWVASEIERTHVAGQPWKSYAVLYRKHNHRDRLVETLRRQRIPFVIRKYSIMSSTVVRDLVAYLRWFAYPADNVSCARVLGIPYWGLQPRDLHRLIERAGKERGQTIHDALEKAAAESAAADGGVIAGPKYAELVAFHQQMGKRGYQTGTATLLDELIQNVQIAPLESDADRLYLERFVEFVQNWEKKANPKHLRDFVEYLDFFAEANGDITLEREPTDDGVQLMTVHAAKGLEFPYVFVMSLCEGDFPSRAQRPVFEFPRELMKEEVPEGDNLRIQEERRLFYVALTRARRQLTLTFVSAKRKKPSIFLEDILMDPKIKAKDAQQLTPDVVLPPLEQAAGPQPAKPAQAQLFGLAADDARMYSRIALWAKAYRPPRPEPLQLSDSAIGAYQTCPQKYSFQYVWGIRGAQRAAMTFGRVMHRTIREFVDNCRRRREIPFEEVAISYNREWRSAGFLDDYQEEEYRREGLLQLEAFCKSYIAAPAHVLHQEKSFELHLENNVVVTGRIDQINKLAPGEVEIIDYKSGRPPKADDAKKSLQLSIYALAARDFLELTAKQVTLYSLFSNQAVSATREAKDLVKAKERIQETADLIRAREFGARPGFACRYCDFKAICPAFEQLISISTASNTSTALPKTAAVSRSAS